jgi:phosphoglycolate phosphatase
MVRSYKAILFDLDGTLLDTAPDLLNALNLLRYEHGLPALPLAAFRPIASLGSKAIVRQGLSIDENHHQFNGIREQFLTLYEQHIADITCFFPQVESVLNYLETEGIPWGIVTNKLTRHTWSLLKALRLDHRPACIICGDSLPTYKPDPAPIRYACQLLKQEPRDCLYVGDAATDVTASKAAGTASLVALYGYLQAEDDPYAWQADGYVDRPIQILDWIKGICR